MEKNNKVFYYEKLIILVTSTELFVTMTISCYTKKLY